MSPTVATLIDFCAQVVAESCSGVLLPPEIEHVVLDPTGEDRVVSAVGSRGKPLSQSKFVDCVGSIWPGLDRTHQAVLAKRPLNPRASAGEREMRSALAGIDLKTLAQIETCARVALVGGLASLSVRMDFEKVTAGSRRRHYYFVPKPEDATPFANSDGHTLSRASLRDCIIFGLLFPKQISDTQALVGLNTFVSVLTFSAEELSKFLGPVWTQEFYDRELVGFTDAMRKGDFTRTLPDVSGPQFAAMVEEEYPARASVPEDADGERGNYLRIYETELRGRPLAELVEMARTVDDGETLCALCHDPRPQVVIAVMDNPHSALVQARLIASHHHSSLGLEAVLKREDCAGDAVVRQSLLRNSAMQEAGLRRILGAFMLLHLFHAAVGHEAGEHAKGIAKAMFINRYRYSPPEAKVDLIFKTGGRCLDLLRGQPLDAAVVRLMLQREDFTPELRNKLERSSNVPPALKRHMSACLLKRRK